MSKTVSIVIIIIMTIIIICAMKYLLYKYTGWIKFNMSNGQNFQVHSLPENISKITFIDTIYTIVATDNTIASRDVSGVLNGMVAAYTGNNNENYIFKLTDPGLNPYSFIINGVSDSKTLNGAKELQPKWNNSTNVTLSGYYKLLS